jgi:hypothetical protein
MTKAVTDRMKKAIAVAGALLALGLSLSMSSPATANAAITPYCNNITLGGWQECGGAARTHYALYGWGDQHSVCVFGSTSITGGAATSSACSGGPGQGVYNPYGYTTYLYPRITNHSYGSNMVHGAAYQP